MSALDETAVLISIQPTYVELIACGDKTTELRKSMPRIGTPFTCYIYQTRMRWLFGLLRDRKLYGLADRLENALGKVVGEFVCDRIDRSEYYQSNTDPVFDPEPRESYIPAIDLDAVCLKEGSVLDYGNKKPLYSWHISKLQIYDEPKALAEFRRMTECLRHGEDGIPVCEKGIACGMCAVQRPPQSWCYVSKQKTHAKE